VSSVLRLQHMITKIFVNLPVKDLEKSMAFFEAVGFKNNPKFTDKRRASLGLVSEGMNCEKEFIRRRPPAWWSPTTSMSCC